jgi:hypothetical protein
MLGPFLPKANGKAVFLGDANGKAILRRKIMEKLFCGGR